MVKGYTAKELLELAERKEKWTCVGRWVQPTLSMCFWPLYTKRKSYRELGLPETVTDNIQLDGYYVELKPNKENIEEMVEKTAEGIDDTLLKRFVEVAEKTTRNHLEPSEKMASGKGNLKETLSHFFDSMDELVVPWIVSIWYSYALERAVGREMEKEKLKHIELASHFDPPRPTLLMRQEREAREFAEYLRDAGLLHLLDAKPQKLIDALSENHRHLAQRITKHLEEFEWVGTHHCWGEPLTMERLFTQIKESLPSKKEEAELKKLPPKLAWLIQWQNELAYWRQYCAETSDVGLFKARTLLRQAAKKLGLSYEEIIWLSDREILKGLEGEGIPSKEEIRAREKGFGYIETQEEELVITGTVLKRLVNIHAPIVDTSVKEFVGTVGSRGMAIGEAFVAFTPQETATMRKGQILVVPQTTPDYIVVMKKAAAIVTDEGGITCHAAIVSRELGIPCVVGTKVGTRVLKTGDHVEVDANSGIVRKL